MVRAKFDYPDLDVLDSPLMSSTFFTPLNGVPGSAIAQNIFNDPDSWEENVDADVKDVQAAFDSPLCPKASKATTADVYGAFEVASHSRRISSSSKITYFPLKLNTSTVAGSSVDGPSPIVLNSSSITLSFVDLYGISDSPHSSRPHYRNPFKPKFAASVVSSPEELSSSSPSRDTLSHPPLNRTTSPIPRSRSPVLTEPSQLPPRTRTRSPLGSRPKSNSRSNSSSDSRSQSPSDSSVEGLSTDNSSRRTRRRLPSIPLSEPESSPARSSSESLAHSSQEQQHPTSYSRPVSVRSSNVGPAGPRSRGNSRIHSQDIPRGRGASLPHRPPALRV